MANRHFAKVGDVWKHLPLVEILAIDWPDRYWESHAGSAVYQMVDGAERRYGVRRFADTTPGFAALAASRYLHHVTSLNDSPQNLARYPGSALLAMLELGTSCAYLVCDLDPESVAMWVGDMMVTAPAGVAGGGHFGSATTPGTGCGVVCANVSQQAVDASRRPGEELEAAYEGASLPDGTRGHLDFAFRTIGSPR